MVYEIQHWILDVGRLRRLRIKMGPRIQLSVYEMK